MPHFVTTDGLKLFYEDEGEGLPVLCLAGLTRDSRDFRYVTPTLLGAGCRVIRLDYRGRGKSDWDENYMNYILPREAADALELLDHLGLEKAAVLGTSRGGLIAMGLTAFSKDRLLGVALNDIGPELDPVGLGVIMTYLGRKPAARTIDEAAAALSHVMIGFEDVPAQRWREEAETFFTEGEDGLELAYDPKLRDAVEAGGETPLPDLWPFYMGLSGLPVAILRGENSNLFTQECYEQMLEKLPGSIGAVVKGRAHVPFLDEPECTDVLTRWIGEMQ